MKVLIVHPQMALYGGAEIVIVKLAKYLQEHNHEVTILTLTSAHHDDYDELDIIVPSFKEERIQWRPRDGSLKTLHELYQIYKSLRYIVRERVNGYDVVNVHNFPAIWAVPNNKPVVWQANEIPDLWHNQKVSRVINPFLNIGRYGDRVISNSKKPLTVVADKRMRSLFEHRYGYRPEIVHYGVDSEFWNCEKQYEGFTVIVPSMIAPSKRQMEILQAINTLEKHIPNLRVIFAGYKARTLYSFQLDKYIYDNSLRDIVSFTGMISREQLRELYRKSSVAVLSGSGQGSWLGGFESLATGTPIIISPKLTCSEIVQSERLGIVSDNYVDNVLEIYTHQEHYHKQVKWQKEWVKENLTWDNYCKSMAEYMRIKLEYS
jgi:glycosyltransferase involved in cell wall biosynthesis